MITTLTFLCRRLAFTVMGVCMFGGMFAQSAELAYNYVPTEQLDQLDEHMSLTEVLHQVKQQKDIRLLYPSKLIEGKAVQNPVNLNASVDAILKTVLAPVGLSFEKMKYKTYRIYSHEKATEGLNFIDSKTEVLNLGINGPQTGKSLSTAGYITSIELRPTEKTITGTVTKGDNTPMEGVTVLAKGTQTGALTDGRGKFSLSVPDEVTTLIFSFIGFARQEVEVGGRSVVDVYMTEITTSLDEVVVVGYGTQAKRDITASISRVSAKEIGEIPVASTIQALQGRVAGMDIQQVGGRPGQAPSVVIRGRRSINASNEPLYVVDGIPLTDGGTAFDINPQDVQSVEILKDAASTSIYGSRGANGVILITTKRGSEGKTTISYDGFVGSTSAIKQVDMMDGGEFADLKREARRIDPATNESIWNGVIQADEFVFFDQTELDAIAQGRSQNYQDMVLNAGFTQNHQIGIRGGTAKTKFLLSANIYDENGIVSMPTDIRDRFPGAKRGMGYLRTSLRLNLDHQIDDWVRVGTSTYLSRTDQDWGSSSAFGEAVANNPLGQPFNDDGSLRFLPTNDGIRTNPLSELAPGAYEDQRLFYTMFASVYLEADITKDLSFRSTFGPDIRFRRRGWFAGSLTNTNRGGPAQARKEDEVTLGYTLENLLMYKKRIGNGNFRLTALQSIQARNNEETWLQGSQLPYESQLFEQLGTSNLTSFGTTKEDWQLASFMGRLNYDIAGKYLFQVSGRADGSSRLAPGNQWAFFPGVSVGWRMIDEDFMQGSSFFQDLKLRGSYGVVGNTSIDPYQTQGPLQRVPYVFGTTGAFGYRLNAISNPELTWEKTATLDIGVDFAFLSGRIEGSLDWYRANTTDLLLERQLPPTSGFASVLENVGATRNTGIEFAVHTVNIDSDNGFRWSTDLNWFRNKEEIVELFNGEDDDVGSGWFIGEPIRVFYDYEKIGIWQINEEDAAATYGELPGEIKRDDVNGNGQFDGDDRKILGSDVPSWSGGLTNRFEYKGVDLSFFLFARMGHMLRSRLHTSNNSLFGRYNNLDVDYWTPDNPTNAFPRPNQDQESAKSASTMQYFEGDYLKLRNVTLGYSVPADVAAKMGMSSFRVYLSAQNPLFWAKYDTYDPEVGGDAEVETGDIPNTKLILGGVNLSF